LRLLLAGIFPVEFRDFFLGDIYCSETYLMGNIEVFFCLYANGWANPAQCSSSSSRLLGFFTTLPGIFRFCQCIRRYYDTRNAFPHLANCAKYGCTILFYMSLSLYRIDLSQTNFVLFCFFATLNSLYVIFWDIFFDWSLGQWNAPHRGLRPVLGFKDMVWVYYAAIPIDVIIRCNWIFYAIYIHEVQHSAILSFLVGLSEVGRRAMWAIFRVENEHCTNVGRFRASHDVSLPYAVSEEHASPDFVRNEDEPRPATVDGYPRPAPAQEPQSPSGTSPGMPGRSGTSAVDVESGASPQMGIRRRRTDGVLTAGSPLLKRVGTMISTAHAQDFERRRPGDLIGGENGRDSERNSLLGGGKRGDQDSSDEEGEEDGDEVEVEAREDERERRREEGEREARRQRQGERHREEGIGAGAGVGRGGDEEDEVDIRFGDDHEARRLYVQGVHDSLSGPAEEAVTRIRSSSRDARGGAGAGGETGSLTAPSPVPSGSGSGSGD